MSKQEKLNDQILALPSVKGVESYVKDSVPNVYDVIIKLESGGLLEARLAGKKDLELLFDAIQLFSNKDSCYIAFNPETKVKK